MARVRAPASPERRAANITSALFMMASMAGFVGNDALMKTLADEMPLFQAMAIRGLFAAALLALLASYQNVLRPPVHGANRKLLAVRVGTEVAGTLCFLNALFHMPLANATAIMMILPLALTLASAIVFGERVGWRRYGAIAIGFLGVVLIVRPGTAGFNAYALSALLAVVFIVVRDLATRRFSEAVPSSFVALASATAIAVVGALLTATVAPVTPSAGQIATLAAAACFLVVGYLFIVMTLRLGDVGFVAPFRFTILIWALILGALVFDEFPDTLTLVGSAIVVGTGVYTLHRERALARYVT